MSIIIFTKLHFSETYYKIECPKNLEKNLLYKMEDYTGSIVWEEQKKLKFILILITKRVRLKNHNNQPPPIRTNAFRAETAVISSSY